MEYQEVQNILAKQKNYFAQGKTRTAAFRKKQLKALKAALKLHEEEITEALYQDLHKTSFEAYATEIGLVYEEIDRHIKKVGRWVKPHKKPTPLSNFKGQSKIMYQPYGHILIVAPWNYPFQLLMMPLVGALSAGNVATLKPSEYTVHTASVIEKIISKTFNSEYVTCLTGDKTFNQKLIAEKWDFIFFTGSPRVGRIIMKTAAENLTPVVLELGGKSPVIVDADANLKVAARRIIWGKMVNAGQTCIAPDYLFVEQSIKDRFMRMLKEQIETFFGSDAKDSPYFPRISTRANVERLSTLIEGSEIYYGGQSNPAERYVAPTLLTNVSEEEPVMQQEIFGPVLPVMAFDDIREVVAFINNRPKPLALYYFTQNKQKARRILNETTSGGACINDVIMHVANPHLPFGGVGNSGTGRYHGKRSFETFSNERAVMEKSTAIDVPLRYPPYTKNKLQWMKRFI